MRPEIFSSEMNKIECGESEAKKELIYSNSKIN
jgi:hypothetical protein